MRDIKRMFRKGMILMVLAVLPFLLSCGKDDKVSASDGSTIEIILGVSEITTTALCPSGGYVDIPVTIVVRDVFTRTVPQAAIYINLSWAPFSSSTGFQAWLLKDDDLSGIAVGVPYRTYTGNFGTKNVTVQVDPGCTATGGIDVFSGTAHGSAEITVSGG